LESRGCPEGVGDIDDSMRTARRQYACVRQEPPPLSNWRRPENVQRQFPFRNALRI